MVKINTRAQSALELTMVTGIATLLLIPLTGVLIYYVDSSFKNIKANQIDEMGDTIISYAGIVYSYGDKARIIVEVNVPAEITNISSVGNSSLLISHKNFDRYHASTDFNLSVNLSEDDWSGGRTKFKLECTDNGTMVRLDRWRKA